MRRAVLVGLVGLGLVGVACNIERAPIVQQPDRVKAVDAAPIDVGPPTFVGVLTAAQTVDIVPRVGGLIAKVHVGTGDTVTADQVVVELDPAAMQEELRAAQAALAAASSAVTKALVDVEDARRKLALETRAVEQGISPTQNVEEARLNVRRAEAIAQQARSAQAVESARVKTVRANVTDTKLRAPFAGTVAQVFRDAGNRVETGSPIVKIVGHGTMRLTFAVPPDLTRKVPVGAHVAAEILPIGVAVTATVKQVTPTIDPASGMIFVEAELDETPKDLRPGLGATVKL